MDPEDNVSIGSDQPSADLSLDNILLDQPMIPDLSLDSVIYNDLINSEPYQFPAHIFDENPVNNIVQPVTPVTEPKEPAVYQQLTTATKVVLEFHESSTNPGRPKTKRSLHFGSPTTRHRKRAKF